MKAAVLLVTCGNGLAGDDGFGPRVAQLLSREPLDGIDVVDLGMRPDHVLDLLEGRKALLIIDAALCPDMSPGHILECDWKCRPALSSERALSTHGATLANQIELAAKLELLPRIVHLIAVNICGTRAGTELSAAVAAQLGVVRQRIIAFLQTITTATALVTEAP